MRLEVRAELPITTMSPPGPRFSSAISPGSRRIVVSGQSARCSVRDITSFG